MAKSGNQPCVHERTSGDPNVGCLPDATSLCLKDQGVLTLLRHGQTQRTSCQGHKPSTEGCHVIPLYKALAQGQSQRQGQHGAAGMGKGLQSQVGERVAFWDTVALAHNHVVY